MRQTIEVLLSSGDVDTWHRVWDAVIESGALHIIEEPTDDSQLDRMKTLTIRSEVDHGPDLPPGEHIKPFLLRATYAPGMWMRVVYKDSLAEQQ